MKEFFGKCSYYQYLWRKGSKKGWQRKKSSYDTVPTKASAYPTGALELRWTIRVALSVSLYTLTSLIMYGPPLNGGMALEKVILLLIGS